MIIYIIPLINNGFHPGSPVIPILKFMIKQALLLSAECTIQGGFQFIITEYRLLGLSRQARGIINAGIHVIPYLLLCGDIFDVMIPCQPQMLIGEHIDGLHTHSTMMMSEFIQ